MGAQKRKKKKKKKKENFSRTEIYEFGLIRE